MSVCRTAPGVDFDGTRDLDASPGQIRPGFVHVILVPWHIFGIALERTRDGDRVPHHPPLHEVLNKTLIVERMTKSLAHVDVGEGLVLVVYAQQEEAHRFIR